MIVGMGIDIQDAAELDAAMRANLNLQSALFSKEEIRYASTYDDSERSRALASIYAAKEAAWKALFGESPVKRYCLGDISLKFDGGTPCLFFSEGAGRQFMGKGIENIRLSISRAGNVAMAVVIFEDEKQAPETQTQCSRMPAYA